MRQGRTRPFPFMDLLPQIMLHCACSWEPICIVFLKFFSLCTWRSLSVSHTEAQLCYDVGVRTVPYLEGPGAALATSQRGAPHPLLHPPTSHLLTMETKFSACALPWWAVIKHSHASHSTYPALNSTQTASNNSFHFHSTEMDTREYFMTHKVLWSTRLHMILQV